MAKKRKPAAPARSSAGDPGDLPPKSKFVATVADYDGPESLPRSALTIKQPWAWLILNGIKGAENRTWHASYRGPLFVHASAQLDRAGLEQVLDHAPSCYYMGDPRGDRAGVSVTPAGSIVGWAELVDVREFTPNSRSKEIFADMPRLTADTPWLQFARRGGYCWCFVRPRRLRQPIFCSGRVSLWTVGDDVLAAVQRSIDAHGLITDPGEPSLWPIDAAGKPAPGARPTPARRKFVPA